MSKNSSAKYYQDNKERQQKSDNMVAIDTKSYKELKNKSCLSLEKYIAK